jgi:signal transduction histidine kinase
VLVEDLLDVSKIGLGKLNLRFEKLNLCEVARETVERLAVVASDAKCSIQMNLSHEIYGFWDRSRIEQTVVNLLTNAIKYAPGKPIILTASSDYRQATLVVEDFGPGIPKDNQSRIFERFERATSSKNIHGLGLGLFIVSQIVRAHEGSIRVESELGRGSKFVVILPLDPTHENEREVARA